MSNQVILKLLDRALPSATPQTAADVLQQSFEIADRFRVAAGPVQTVEQIADAVILRLKPSLGAAAGSISSELEVYERVNGLLDKVGAGRALDGGGGAAPPWWVSLLAPILDGALRPLVPLAINYFASKSGPVANGGPVPVPPVPFPSVASAAPGPVLLGADAPLMSRVIQVAELALAKQSEGVTGSQFAGWLLGFYPGGNEVFDYLAERGTDGCMGLIAMVPALKARLTDTGAVTDWLDEFFGAGDESAGDELLQTAGAGA
jgi:hypothetical protein